MALPDSSDKRFSNSAARHGSAEGETESRDTALLVIILPVYIPQRIMVLAGGQLPEGGLTVSDFENPGSDQLGKDASQFFFFRCGAAKPWIHFFEIKVILKSLINKYLKMLS